MAAAEVRLKSPLPCWHESLASARTDPLVSLSLEGGHIQTDRPLPAGTPVFLELSLGQSLGSEKTEIDAVAETARNGAPGFFVRFLRVEERARVWIEERVRLVQSEQAELAAPAPSRPQPPEPLAAPMPPAAPDPLDEPTREPAITVAKGPPATSDPLDEPTREPAIALAPRALDAASTTKLDLSLLAAADSALEPGRDQALEPDLEPALQPNSAQALEPDLDLALQPDADLGPELDPFAAPFDDVTAPLPPAPGDEVPLADPLSAAADPHAWQEQGAALSAPEPPAPAPASAPLQDIESTQRWAVPPTSVPSAAPEPIAAPAIAASPPVAEALSAAVGFEPAPTLPAAAPPRALAAEPSLDETQPWARAGFDSIPPRPLPAPDGLFEDVDSTRPWARAELSPTPIAPAPTPPAAVAPAPVAPAPVAPAPIAPAPIAAFVEVTPPPPAPPPPAPHPPSPPPRTATPPMVGAASPFAAPLPRMAQLDVPGGIPAAQSFNETMRWPVAQVRVAQPPLEVPVSASAPSPPPDIEGADTPVGPVADAGLDALFGPAPDEEPPAEPVRFPDVQPAQPRAQASAFDAPAAVTDAPRLQSTPPSAANPFDSEPPAPVVANVVANVVADDPFGASGGFLGAADDDIPVGGNGAFDFGPELTDPGARSDESSSPPLATLEDGFAPPEPAIAEPDIEAATEESALPSDLDEDDAVTDAEPMELLDAELEEYRDVLGDAFAPAPAPSAAASFATAPAAPLAAAPVPSAIPSVPSTNPFAAFAAAAVAPAPLRSATPRPHVTQPFFATADVAAALAAAPAPAPVPASTRSTDPLFPAYRDPPAPIAVIAAAPVPTAPPPLPVRTSPPTLMFAAADVNAAVAAAARPPAMATGAMLTNELPPAAVGALPAALAAQLPGDAEFELAFQMAEPPARSTAHEPGAWAVSAQPAADDDLPLIVGDTELPVIMGTPKSGEHAAPSAPPESWVVPKKPG